MLTTLLSLFDRHIPEAGIKKEELLEKIHQDYWADPFLAHEVERQHFSSARRENRRILVEVD